MQGVRRLEHLRAWAGASQMQGVCGGAGICEHVRVRSECKECGGSGICEHGGGCVANARSAAAQASASMGGGVPLANARSAAAQASASMGGGVADARSAAARASASMGGSGMAVRNAVLSEILRRSTLLLSNTKPRKLLGCSTFGARSLQYQ